MKGETPTKSVRGLLLTGVSAALAGALVLVACSSDRVREPQGEAAASTIAATSAVAASATTTPEPAVPAPAPTFRLISQSEYDHSVQQIFGSDVAVKIRFAPITRIDGLLSVGRSTAVLTGGALDPLDASARSVAAQVVDPSHRAFLIPCKPKNASVRDDRCARTYFKRVGRLLYRRPLSARELTRAVNTAGDAVGITGDFYRGLSFALSGMLISPQFLFVRETAEPDPSKPGAYRLTAYSKAARLSFLLWNASPDDELLRAAEHGELNSTKGLERQLDRMFGSPLYRQGVRAFFTDFFVLESFDTLSKDPIIYPAFTLKAVNEAREQILRTVVDHLVDRDGDYRDLFTTRRTYLSSDLAVLYRLQVDLGSQGWVPYEFPEGDPRGGLLTQIGFLAQYSHPGRSSATRRGRAIRETLLCQKVPDPPPNVNFSILEDPHAHFHTARERLAAHMQNPVCAGCHRLTDPIGLALENFDGAGQYRATENGAPIDASGKLDGQAFSDGIGLGRALRNNRSLKSCFVNRLYAYSVGRKIAPEDKPLLQYYEGVLDQRGYRFDQALRLMILDRSFFAVSAPDVTPLPAPTVASNSLPTDGAVHAHQD